MLGTTRGLPVDTSKYIRFPRPKGLSFEVEDLVFVGKWADLWRNADAVFVQPLVGVREQYGSVGDALASHG
jgi:hypothetical protein